MRFSRQRQLILRPIDFSFYRQVYVNAAGENGLVARDRVPSAKVKTKMLIEFTEPVFFHIGLRRPSVDPQEPFPLLKLIPKVNIPLFLAEPLGFSSFLLRTPVFHKNILTKRPSRAISRRHVECNVTDTNEDR